jgi:predicted MPP superfamily phosphohydrolase
VLHISDLHVDINEGAVHRLTELLPGLDYDLCVLTGDYRGATFGAFDAALEGLARVRSKLRGQVYGVLGNHDTIRMVPGLEEMRIRMLLNECGVISRNDQRIYLAGIDDAHYYRADNIEKAASGRQPVTQQYEPAFRIHRGRHAVTFAFRNLGAALCHAQRRGNS